MYSSVSQQHGARLTAGAAAVLGVGTSTSLSVCCNSGADKQVAHRGRWRFSNACLDRISQVQFWMHQPIV